MDEKAKTGLRVVELSHRMIPGKESFSLETRTFDVTELLPEVKHRPDIWYVLSDIKFSSHMGTHIEFPFHHWQDGADAATFPLDRLIGNAVVLDFSHKHNGDCITLAELQACEPRLHEGDIIFIRTDMDKLFRDERWNEQPYIEAVAIDWLINTYQPRVLGTDATGFEVPGTDYQPNHLNLFKHNIPMIESATNLAALGDERVTVFILPLPIEGIEACPVRIVAVMKEGLLDG
jgi:arylformamidase